MRRTRLATMMAVLAASWARAYAQTPAPAPAPEPQYPIVSVGVLSYLQYSAETENRDGYNAFDLTRGYINITADIAKNVKFRLTPDVRRVTDSSLSGSLVFRVKYGFAQFDNVLGQKSWLRLGVHQTPWLDFEESINRYRVQGQMFAEREGLIPGSGDFGAGYFTPLPGNYGEVQAGVYNGEGFGRAEVNKYKSFQARGTYRPFPDAPIGKGFRVSGFYNLGWYSADHPRRLGIIMASFEHPKFVGTAQWVAGTDRPDTAAVSANPRGASFFAEVRQGGQGWAAIVRFDRFSPDHNTSDNVDRRFIGGAAYWLTYAKTRIGFVIDDEIVRYDTGLHKNNEQRLLFQTHIQF